MYLSLTLVKGSTAFVMALLGLPKWPLSKVKVREISMNEKTTLLIGWETSRSAH